MLDVMRRAVCAVYV